MDILFQDFQRAHIDGSGPLLASTIEPKDPPDDPGRLRRLFLSSTSSQVAFDMRAGLLDHSHTSARFTKREGQAWVDVYAAYWKAIGEIVWMAEGTRVSWDALFLSWKEFSNALIKGYSSSLFAAWTVPCLYIAGKYLRVFAINADLYGKGPKTLAFSGGLQDEIAGTLGKNDHLEEAARMINRLFQLCISDRAPLEESRKWGLYYTTNLLFKTYFKLNSISLCKNILKALAASRTDMPDIELFPKSHLVTFRYYVGVIHFLEEDYAKAEESLTEALRICHQHARRNKEMILTYLIPCRLLTTHTLPSGALLRPHPALAQLFGPLAAAVRRGELAAFDTALAAGEADLVRRRVYLTCERGRDVCLRNLLRRVYLAGGWEDVKEGEPRARRTRVPMAEFVAAVRVSNGGAPVERDEVECLLANMIYKNLVKGYIARDRGIVVLSRNAAFPGTGV